LGFYFKIIQLCFHIFKTLCQNADIISKIQVFNLSYCPHCIPFFLFITFVIIISNTIKNKLGKSRHHCLTPDSTIIGSDNFPLCSTWHV
jgi:hypothetical protein